MRIQNDFGFFLKKLTWLLLLASPSLHLRSNIRPGWCPPYPTLLPTMFLISPLEVFQSLELFPKTRYANTTKLINYSLEALFDRFWSKFTVLLPTMFFTSTLEVFQSLELFPKTRYANTYLLNYILRQFLTVFGQNVPFCCLQCSRFPNSKCSNHQSYSPRRGMPIILN